MPFNRFPGADTQLGPEMKSTGEVMGIADTFPQAFAKARRPRGQPLPTRGHRLPLGVRHATSRRPPSSRSACTGSASPSTPRGARPGPQSLGIPANVVNKVIQGEPHVVDLIESGDIDLVVNTPFGRGARSDGYEIRPTALRKGIPCITTLAGASAAVSAIEAARRPSVKVHCLQDLHAAAEES